VLTTNCTGRQASAVVLQALTMLNDEFVRTQAAAVADRAAGSAKPGDEADAALRLVLGRPPTATEAKIAADLLAAQRARGASPRHALAHLCDVLLNTSEFLYAP